jgi:hypothetical protein
VAEFTLNLEFTLSETEGKCGKEAIKKVLKTGAFLLKNEVFLLKNGIFLLKKHAFFCVFFLPILPNRYNPTPQTPFSTQKSA